MLLRIAIALFAALTLPVAAADLPLRVMATSDVHMHLLAHDYYQDRPTERYGYALTLRLIEQARREQANHLLFDNGDLLQGSPLGDVAARTASDDHPAYRLLRVARVDAATLGNHEFNYGLPFLQRAVRGAGFPVLSANVVRPGTKRPVFQPSTLLQRRWRDTAGRWHALRVGVIGLTPPQIMAWDRRHLAGRVEALDMVAVARDEVSRLRRRGADLVVIVAHTGLDTSGRGSHEHAGQALAQIPGVDALILGHAHAEWPGPGYAHLAGLDAATGRVHGVPAVMPGRWGDHLGIIDLTLRRDTQGRWRVREAQSTLRRVSAEGSPLPALLVSDAHAATLARMREPLAQSTQSLHSDWALVADSLSVELAARAQAWRARQWLADTPWAGLPLLSASAPFRAGGRPASDNVTRVPAGTLTQRHVNDLYVFPNSLKVVRVSGAELQDWLERSAGQFRTIDPLGEAVQDLIASHHPAYNFDVIEGVSYEIDPSQPPRFGPGGERLNPHAQRVLNLRHHGVAVLPEQVFLVATNSYRAGGGGQFPGLGPDRVVIDSEDDMRDVLSQYLQHRGTVTEGVDHNWRIRTVPGVRFRMRNAPVAADTAPPDWRRLWDGDAGWAVFERQPD
ncbi:MAG: bifunctional 2',3'-cyclic-nucleotide 2'-phosphodiesterase/3'-nucleotidase [Inhella sp.]|uniref:bifunctional 2',3'-cyclic-nucleotide 2'-phosphodiesterase/3'-nucleotidase n=1 Tax=Inhella sp. TaxID=1921806 RepID=UPI0022BD1343|nr:bifunctional 2',3'-cyclic-nucleotide 2'-phosphodiesterase/3'-nucleotidase [Inhella sp.]MCZ8235794.1 bifunctional 2',3'-cyclic-nucleotide 2'-phosphodiesterase/3'-nucleotidase [Inhella sp.]